MIDNVIQATCVLTNVAKCKNECKGKYKHQKVSKSTVNKYVGGAEKAYQDITTMINMSGNGSLQNLDSGLDYGHTALLNYSGSDQCLSQ